jgi:hypothetical protein
VIAYATKPGGRHIPAGGLRPLNYPQVDVGVSTKFGTNYKA